MLIYQVPSKQAPVLLAVKWIVGNLPGSRANNIHPGSDKLTEVQLYRSTRQPGYPSLLYAEKPIYFLILLLKLPN